VMSVSTDDKGGLHLHQRLTRPVVFLDHWAIRTFAEDVPLQARFIAALHGSGGTWLFSAANLFEFVAMTDLQQAEAAETLLLRAMPAVHVADTTMDKGYLFADGAPPHPEAPDEHWMLKDLAERAQIAGGTLNTRRFVSDAIAHRDRLLPIFVDMKASIAEAVMAIVDDPQKNANAKKFTPSPGMTLRDALFQELVRDPHIDPNYRFDENDAVDLIHALPAASVCDLVLLDARWCHKVNSATRRLREAGVKGKIARCFSRKTLPDFLATLERMTIR